MRLSGSSGNTARFGKHSISSHAEKIVIGKAGLSTPLRSPRESIRAKLRLLVKKVLRRHGYPPDKQEKATRTVLEQAELLSAEWVT